ncbi:MAG: lysozyme inhibitor LprI family protein [Stagnimonas sp.]|nr:lysozyme inhibitor LprI family protein [Stagnimonas sp.]
MKSYVVALALSLPCLAVVAEPRANCSSGATPDVVACAKSKADESEQRLASTYHALLANMRKSEQEWLRQAGSLSGPLAAAQKDWLKYRGSNCAYYFEAVNGTLAPAAELTCIERMNDEREAELRKAFMEAP